MTISHQVRDAREAMVTAVRKQLAREFFSHTVVFARTPVRWDGPAGDWLKWLVGSGTLAQVDVGKGQTRYGVLTCGHVLGAFERPVPGTQTRKVTLLVPATGSGRGDPAYSATFGYDKEIATIVGAGNTSIDGPDLAWLPLTHEQARSLQDNACSRAVFYNLTTGFRAQDSYKTDGRRQGPRSTDRYLKQHVYMAVGWNHEIQARSGGVRGGIWMNEVLPENISADERWLYAEYRIKDDSWVEQTYGDGTRLPASWQGLSGGAVWHVWRPDATEERFEKMLVGVPFYEISQTVERSMTIRVHHDLSLVRLLHQAGIAAPDMITEADIMTALREVPSRPPAPSIERQ